MSVPNVTLLPGGAYYQQSDTTHASSRSTRDQTTHPLIWCATQVSVCSCECPHQLTVANIQAAGLDEGSATPLARPHRLF